MKVFGTRTVIAITTALLGLGLTAYPVLAADLGTSPDWQAMPGNSTLQGYTIEGLTADTDGSVYAAYHTQSESGVAAFNPTTQTWTSTAIPGSSTTIADIVSSGSGVVYFEDMNGNLYDLAKGTIHTLSNSAGLDQLQQPNVFGVGSTTEILAFDNATGALYGIFTPSGYDSTNAVLMVYNPDAGTWSALPGAPSSVVSVAYVNGTLYALTDSATLYAASSTVPFVWKSLGVVDANLTSSYATNPIEQGYIGSDGTNLYVADDQGTWVGTPGTNGTFTWSTTPLQSYAVASLGSFEGQMFGFGAPFAGSDFGQVSTIVQNAWTQIASPPGYTSTGFSGSFVSLNNWTSVDQAGGVLYAGTDGHGVYRLSDASSLSGQLPELPFASFTPLALAGAAGYLLRRKRK